MIEVTPLQDQIDLALVWGSATPDAGTWTAPRGHGGFELRIIDEGGRLTDRGHPKVVLRWFYDAPAEGDAIERAWFIPAAALGPIEGPDSVDAVTLWSQPRFLVD